MISVRIFETKSWIECKNLDEQNLYPQNTTDQYKFEQQRYECGYYIWNRSGRTFSLNLMYMGEI